MVQAAFLALTVYAVFAVGANAELWCPFGGIEAIYEYVQNGSMLCSLGVSNFYILGALLVMALVMRRAFCGYMCPIGTVSELLSSGAGRLGIKPRAVRPGVDRGLSLLKYPVLAVILYFSWTTAELVFRGYDPCYVLISRHGKDITLWAYVISGAIVLASLVVVVPFCRWLCPLAAVLNPFSRLGWTRIKRHEKACTDCKLCNRACLMAIPVAEVSQVKHARCYACYDCIEACPPNAKGSLTLESPRAGSRPWSQVQVIGVMLLLVAMAVGSSFAWPLPSFVREREAAVVNTEQVELGILNMTCRGKTSTLWSLLEREDEFAIDGYLKLEAWPGPGFARARVTFDADSTDGTRVKEAITSPFFDAGLSSWEIPIFEIEGYDPYGLGE